MLKLLVLVDQVLELVNLGSCHLSNLPNANGHVRPTNKTWHLNTLVDTFLLTPT